MKIENGWQTEDVVSGLRLTVIKGERMNRLHIEHIGKPICMNRDFFFTEDGKFDGTGSSINSECSA